MMKDQRRLYRKAALVLLGLCFALSFVIISQERLARFAFIRLETVDEFFELENTSIVEALTSPSFNAASLLNATSSLSVTRSIAAIHIKNDSWFGAYAPDGTFGYIADPKQLSRQRREFLQVTYNHAGSQDLKDD